MRVDGFFTVRARTGLVPTPGQGTMRRGRSFMQFILRWTVEPFRPKDLKSVDVTWVFG